jgi:hypothetical protein
MCHHLSFAACKTMIVFVGLIQHRVAYTFTATTRSNTPLLHFCHASATQVTRLCYTVLNKYQAVLDSGRVRMIYDGGYSTWQHVIYACSIYKNFQHKLARHLYSAHSQVKNSSGIYTCLFC